MDCFEYAPKANPVDRLAVLQEAEFYSRELDRRHDSWVSLRGLILEIAVIALIGWEIFLGYQQERNQAASAKLQQQILTDLQTSSAKTAEILGNVNEGIQAQLGLNFDVAIEMEYDYKFGGLHACGATFRYVEPLPNIFLTRLFSKTRLKRKDFQEIVRLTWAQEAECAEYQGRSLQFSGKQVMRAVSEMQCQSEKEPQCASVVSELATIRQECVGRERYFYERNPGCHV